MKKALLLSLLFASTVFANRTYEQYPSIPVTDAMGTKQVSIKNFCMSADKQTLIGRVNSCVKVKHLGRGYKECAKYQSEDVAVSNSFTNTVFGPRGRRTVNSYSYDRDILVDVIEHNYRSGQKITIDQFVHTIPGC